jgi:hypothetical protein
VFVNVTGSSARVLEPEDLKRLAVRVDTGADLVGAIAAIGRVDVDGEHVWLDIDALRTAAADGMDPAGRDAWIVDFDSMVAYATSKGWTSADGAALRAHIERA